MSKVAKRLLVFFIGIPCILFLVFCNVLNHLPINLTITLFAALGANELYTMLRNKNFSLCSRPVIIIFTLILPLLSYIFIYAKINLDIIFWIFIIQVVFLMASEVFTAKSFEKSIEKIVYSLFTVFYVGFFATFISRITLYENSVFVLALFFILVFMCDSGAWFFGVLFGKNNRGIIAASPNKSLVGFIGGILTSIFFGLCFKFIFPEIFTVSYLKIGIIGLVTALSSIVGDLSESVIKRSLDAKDSGSLIPGRGGVLDSIDSILVAAPVFYIAIRFLF